MTDRVNVEKAVRRSLEAALAAAPIIADLRLQVPASVLTAFPEDYGTAMAPKFPIWWPNQPFYANPDGGQDAKPPFYIRVSHHPATPRARTIGPNPRVLLRGHSILGCHIPLGMGEDLIDNLANAAQAAYPYAGVFVRDGFDTRIDGLDPKGAFSSDGRWFKPVHILWNCWRST